ncbi:MAG: hypothetical protein LBM93_05100 [Oscillospiraceae bacterium]|jgi:hypothetical protein|nr:hypothetical protein [Oscillospiraceae bacterium]
MTYGLIEIKGGNLRPFYPFTGNGFTGSKNNLIPEYRIPKGDSAKITSGNIYRIDRNGNSELVEFFDKNYTNKNGTDGAFIKLGDLK